MSTGAFAQQQGKIRGSLNLGYAIPTGGGGVATDLQLGYNVRDNLNVGVKWGGAGMARVDPTGENGSVSFNSSYLATSTYFLNSGSSKFAPFGGLGLGLYQLTAFGAGNDGISVAGGNKLGGLLTAGFELGKLRVGAEYNLIPRSKVTYTAEAPKRTTIPNSYLGVTVGFVIGGGSWGGK